MGYVIYKSYCEQYHDFILDSLLNKWNIIRKSFKFLPEEIKESLITDYKETLLRVNVKRFPKRWKSNKRIFIKSIILCFGNEEFIEHLLIDPMDGYFFEFDSCLKYGGSVAMIQYPFLNPLLRKEITKIMS